MTKETMKNIPESLEKMTKLHQTIVARAWEDGKFCEALRKNPHAAIKSLTGISIPAEIKLTVVEDTDTHRYIVLPKKAGVGDELSDNELEAVSGGRKAQY